MRTSNVILKYKYYIEDSNLGNSTVFDFPVNNDPFFKP